MTMIEKGVHQEMATSHLNLLSDKEKFGQMNGFVVCVTWELVITGIIQVPSQKEEEEEEDDIIRTDVADVHWMIVPHQSLFSFF